VKAEAGEGEGEWRECWLWSLEDECDSCDESREWFVEWEPVRNLDANIDNERLALRAIFLGRRSACMSIGRWPGCGLSVDLRGGGLGKALTSTRG
jgi:hypothetical protein